MLRLTLYLLNLIVLAGVAGCAPASPPKIVAPPAAVSGGTIVSMRTVYTPATAAPLQSVLLTDGVRSTDSDRSLTEFIVRTDDGATVSIVQANGPGFHAGDRVVILHDGNAHLARPQ